MRHPSVCILAGLWLSQLCACSDKFSTETDTGGEQAGSGGTDTSSGGSASEGGDGGSGSERGGGGGDGSTGAGEGGMAHGGGDSGLGGEPSAGGAGSTHAGGAPPDGCSTIDDCPSAQNCVAGRCVPALVSCAAQKNSYPASQDGVYWIGAAGATQRTYCDMRLSAELCSEIQGEHRGRTRDKAAIDYTMTSVLLLSEGVCKMWAIRGTDKGHPFNRLVARGGLPADQTCTALGFAGDGELGNCAYGSDHTSCGFTATPLNRYGNYCTGCTLNNGEYGEWTLQGPIHRGDLLSTMSGTTFTTCLVETR